MTDRKTKVNLGVQFNEYIDGFEKAAQKTRQLGSEVEKLGAQREAFERLGRGLIVTGAALTAATVLSVKAAIDWETAWAGVTKTVDGSASEMDVLEDQLRSLATTLPATHQEIAAVAEAAGQLGVAREDVAAFTRVMIDLSETTNLTADEAATSIAQLMNVMQTAPEDVDNLGAALVALGNDGASTERDIVQMAQRIAGAGRIVGLTEAQVLGFANALASVGIEAEAGGTAISRIMTDIAMSVSAGGEDLEKFAEVAGMSSAEFSTAFKTAPAEAIATFVEGLGRINAEGGDVFQTLSDLGQSDIRVSQALLGMANSGDLLRNSLELGSSAWEDNLALIDEARKRYETTEARIQIMNNSINDAAISMGEVFLPAVKAGADGIAGFAQLAGDLPEPVQGLVGIFGAVAAAIALSGGAALLAVPKIAEFRVALQTLGTTAGRVAFIGGGVTLALTALVAVVGGVAVAQAEARQLAESYAQALRQGAEAAEELAIQNLAVEKTLVGLNFGSAYDNAEKLGIGLDLVSEAAQGNKKAIEELNAILDIATGGGDAAQKMADELGISLLDLAQSGGTLRDAVSEQNNALDRGREINRQSKEATEQNAESTKTAAEAYKQAASESESLNNELSSLIDTINKANGVGQDAVSANIAYQDALADVDETIKNAREGVEGYALTLDQSSQAGRDNLGMLNDLAGRYQDAAEKQFALDGNTENYIANLQAGRDAVLQRARDLGATDEQIQMLSDTIVAMPSEKEVQIIAETQAAQEAINRFIFNNDGRRINLIVDGVPGRQVNGVNMIARAAGGPVWGPGTGTSDSVPMMASNGEHVWTAAEVNAAGGHAAVEAMRKWVKSGQGFMSGGAMQGASSATASGPATFNLFDADGVLIGTMRGQVASSQAESNRQIRAGVRTV